tara:strand:+ start:29 stop:415 length:387 start_codon:yes stop_codon:yes gene_type:complete
MVNFSGKKTLRSITNIKPHIPQSRENDKVGQVNPLNNAIEWDVNKTEYNEYCLENIKNEEGVKPNGYKLILYPLHGRSYITCPGLNGCDFSLYYDPNKPVCNEKDRLAVLLYYPVGFPQVIPFLINIK